MPHNVPEEKEWLHLRDAICLGDVDAVVDQLLMEGVAVEYGEVEAELVSLKTNLGWDACAVVDKETFKESINNLISMSIAIPQPQDAPEFRTYKDSLAGGRWDRIFDDMVGRTSGRSAPSHYTDDEQAAFDLLRDAHEVGHHGDAPPPPRRPRGGPRIPDLPVGTVPPGLAMPDFPVDPKFLAMKEKRELGIQYLVDNPKIRHSVVAQIFGVSTRTIKSWLEQARAAGLPVAEAGEWGGPSHYTDETPEGALEAMERRLSSGFSEQMAEALAQMELRVGELSEAVRRMGASVPAPIVEAVEAVEDAVEAVEAGGTLSRRRARAIREYIVGLGERASEESARSVVVALQGSFPGITERDVTNATRTIPGGNPLGRSPTVRQPRQPEPGIPMPQRGKSLIVANYLVGLGADAANTDMETFLAGINAANPGLSPPVELHDYHATVRRFPDLPRLSLVGRGVGGGTRPGERSGLSLEDRLQRGYQRPDRVTQYGF